MKIYKYTLSPGGLAVAIADSVAVAAAIIDAKLAEININRATGGLPKVKRQGRAQVSPYSQCVHVEIDEK